MPEPAFWSAAAGAAVVVLVYMTAWFVVALAAKRNDVADVAWGIGFIVIAAWLLLRDEAALDTRHLTVSALVLIWGGRLAWHIGRRNLKPGHKEDRRYAAWREEWGKWFVPRTFAQVFLLQGFFMLLISTPVLLVGSAEPGRLGALSAVGVAVWIAGFIIESAGDAQLAAFRGDPANRGKVMDRGLWSWTRHPNYFGEATMWWGIALLALGVPGGWVGLLGPITITWLLTMVSGIPLAENGMEGREGWAAYKARTSAFVPLPPKKGAA